MDENISALRICMLCVCVCVRAWCLCLCLYLYNFYLLQNMLNSPYAFICLLSTFNEYSISFRSTRILSSFGWVHFYLNLFLLFLFLFFIFFFICIKDLYVRWIYIVISGEGHHDAGIVARIIWGAHTHTNTHRRFISIFNFVIIARLCVRECVAHRHPALLKYL